MNAFPLVDFDPLKVKYHSCSFAVKSSYLSNAIIRCLNSLVADGNKKEVNLVFITTAKSFLGFNEELGSDFCFPSQCHNNLSQIVSENKKPSLVSRQSLLSSV